MDITAAFGGRTMMGDAKRFHIGKFDCFGPRIAFACFGRVERAICMRVPIVGVDGWSSSAGSSQDRFREDLLAALRFNSRRQRGTRRQSP
jgi:hypothetical protein